MKAFIRIVIAVAAASGMLFFSDDSWAGPNARTSIVLHAQSESVFCAIEDPCLSPNQPVVTITEPGKGLYIYVIARNYNNIAYIQWAFDWPPTWSIVPWGYWLCPPGSIGAPEQPPYGPGPIAGSCASAFNCISSGTSQVIGWVWAVPGEGCLEIIESGHPGGTHVGSCQNEIDLIPSMNRARVCVGESGLNTCESAVPVASTTWGAIKDTYR